METKDKESRNYIIDVLLNLIHEAEVMNEDVHAKKLKWFSDKYDLKLKELEN